MNLKQTEFEWDYVPAQVRRRVRRLGAAILMVALAIGVILGGEGGDDVRYYYEAIAIEGNLGHVIRETQARETQEENKVEPPRAAPQPEDEPVSAVDLSDSLPPLPPLLDPPETIVQVAAAAHALLAVADELESPIEPSPPPRPPVAPPAPLAERDQPAERDSPADRDPPAREADQPLTSEGQPDDERSIPDSVPPPAHGGLAETDGESGTASTGSHNIVEGVTAPYYRLTSLDEYRRTAGEHGGRFLAWNGQTAISIGRSLDPEAATLEVLGPSWHRRYATRMAPLPQDDPLVLAILQRVRTYNPSMGDRTQIMLSLPYAYDQEILRSQREWFESRGLAVDMQAETEGRFQPAARDGVPRFQIEQVLREGRPIAQSPVPQQPPLLNRTDERVTRSVSGAES